MTSIKSKLHELFSIMVVVLVMFAFIASLFMTIFAIPLWICAFFGWIILSALLTD